MFLKKCFPLAICLAIVGWAVPAGAQQKAVTELGDQVILYENGTWKYVDEKKKPATGIADAKPARTVNKPADAGFLAKSRRLNYGVWIDPTEWQFKKAGSDPDDDPAADMMFELKGAGNAYAMVLAEDVGLPLSAVLEQALTNARQAAPDAEIVMQEKRVVNGRTVVMMQIDCTIRSIPFSYLSYYYTDKSMTIQFIAYTFTSKLDKYRRQMERLLNGFVVLDDSRD